MALFFLSYDLRGERDYQKLYDELEKFHAVRILESEWCFNRFNIDARGLRDYFKQFIDSNDGLCVSEVADWAPYNAQDTPNDLK